MVLARKLVNSPVSPGISLPAWITSCTTVSRVPKPRSARSSITILKPPAVPKPSTGGAPRMLTSPSRTSFSNRCFKSAVMTSAVRCSSARLWKSSSITYIEPKFDALAESSSDWPAMATVCFTPSTLSQMRSMSAITSSVRPSDAESGKYPPRSGSPGAAGGRSPWACAERNSNTAIPLRRSQKANATTSTRRLALPKGWSGRRKKFGWKREGDLKGE